MTGNRVRHAPMGAGIVLTWVALTAASGRTRDYGTETGPGRQRRPGRRRHRGQRRRHGPRALRQADGRDGRRRAAERIHDGAAPLQPAVARQPDSHDDPAVELLHRRRARRRHAEHGAGARARRRRARLRAGLEHRRRPDGGGRLHPDAERRVLREQRRRRRAARSADCSGARSAPLPAA